MKFCFDFYALCKKCYYNIACRDVHHKVYNGLPQCTKNNLTEPVHLNCPILFFRNCINANRKRYLQHSFRLLA